MDIHYNAFISYRHHPLDIKVAEQIHKGLEHYRIPKAIKKNHDGKLRLFRDKEELPITSNLTDDITKALENSDFLIVICSTHTKESIWVQREIETFLKTHDHSRVLTVLVDGQDPYEILPEILCSQESIDPETGEKAMLPIEPLSCDWRVGKRKAYLEELPRLAAALLGCGYDELRQRERQYRTRRLVTVFSLAMAAALGLMSYVLFNSLQIQKMNDQLTVANDQLTDANIRIQENLDEALINQSQYLASASAQQMEAGDRMMAMALALAALPEGNERPYVTEAERALGEAIGIYQAEDNPGAIGTIVCDAIVQDFVADEERTMMFVTDSRNTLSVWDLENFRKKASIQLEEMPYELMLTPSNNLVVTTSDWKIDCYDPELNLLWRKENCDNAVWSKDHKTLLIQKDDVWLEFVDADSGEEQRAPLYVRTQESIDADAAYTTFFFKREEYDLSAPILLQYYDRDPYQLISVDTNTDTVTLLEELPEEYNLRYSGVTADGNILALFAHEHGGWNGMFNLMMTRSPVPVEVRCYSPAGELLWTTPFTTYSYAGHHALEVVNDDGLIFCQIDNVVATIDGTTGELLTTCEIGKNPIWIQTQEDSAVILQEDGAVGAYYYEENEYNSWLYYKDDLVAGFAGKGVFVQQRNTSQILVYGSPWDENWQPLTGDYGPTSLGAMKENRVVWNHLLAVSYYDGIWLFDLQQGKLLWNVAEDKENYEKFQLMGFSNDGSKLWVCCDGDVLTSFDTATGQREDFPMPDKFSEEVSLYYTYSNFAVVEDDRAYFLATDLSTDDVYAVVRDGKDDTLRATKVCAPVEGHLNAGDGVILAGQGHDVYLWELSTASVYKANVETDEIKVLQENVTSRPVVQFLEDGRYLLCTENRVALCSAEDKEDLVITLEDAKGISGYLMDDQLILLVDSGDLVRYDLQGNKLGDVETHLYTSFFTTITDDYLQEEIQWTRTADGDLVVEILDAGNLIDTENWQLKAWIPQCVTYYKAGDQFLTYGSNDKVEDGFGFYPRYSLEDIKAMAAEELKGFELSQEQKEQYGIS